MEDEKDNEEEQKRDEKYEKQLIEFLQSLLRYDLVDKYYI